jgi:putative phosphoribosyl transferase
MIRPFYDRRHAGEILAQKLLHFADRTNTVVIALPRGGVPVGFEVARALRAPLDICLVRKLGVPGQEELAMGAIASGGVRIVNEALVHGMGIPQSILDQVAARELREMERQEHLYRSGRAGQTLAHRTALLVDDGLATDSSMRAAVAALRAHDVESVVIGVPVAAQESAKEFFHQVDDFICVTMPPYFRAVGEWYEDFSPTTDEQVRNLLDRADQMWQLTESYAGHTS